MAMPDFVHRGLAKFNIYTEQYKHKDQIILMVDRWDNFSFGSLQCLDNMLSRNISVWWGKPGDEAKTYSGAIDVIIAKHKELLKLHSEGK